MYGMLDRNMSKLDGLHRGCWNVYELLIVFQFFVFLESDAVGVPIDVVPLGVLCIKVTTDEIIFGGTLCCYLVQVRWCEFCRWGSIYRSYGDFRRSFGADGDCFDVAADGLHLAYIFNRECVACCYEDPSSALRSIWISSVFSVDDIYR